MGSCDDRKSSMSRLKQMREISGLVRRLVKAQTGDELQVKVVPLVQFCHIILPEQV